MRSCFSLWRGRGVMSVPASRDRDALGRGMRNSGGTSRWFGPGLALALALHGRPGVAAPPPPPPANDTCSAPIAITALPFDDSGTIVNAANDVDTIAAGCSDLTQVSGPDVVYTLDLQTGNNLTFTVT